MLDARCGKPIVILVVNDLPMGVRHRGFGIPQTVTHADKPHTAEGSNGGTWNRYPISQFKDRHRMLASVGFLSGARSVEFHDEPGSDTRETLTTLILHDTTGPTSPRPPSTAA